MSRLFITGDKHGEIEIYKLDPTHFPAGTLLDREDILVIAGDFGLFFHPRQTRGEREALEWLDRQPWTTLFIDGNHENFDRLKTLPRTERFGGPVGVAGEHIFHLQRGEIYQLAGESCFVMGGASSTDKGERTPGLDWWPEEAPSQKEMQHGWDSLCHSGWEVDIVITHAAPLRLLPHLKDFREKMAQGHVTEKTTRNIIDKSYEIHFKDPSSIYLEEIAGRLRFDRWFFGHYHMNVSFHGGYEGVYHRIWEWTQERWIPID